MIRFAYDISIIVDVFVLSRRFHLRPQPLLLPLIPPEASEALEGRNDLHVSRDVTDSRICVTHHPFLADNIDSGGGTGDFQQIDRNISITRLLIWK